MSLYDAYQNSLTTFKSAGEDIILYLEENPSTEEGSNDDNR